MIGDIPWGIGYGSEEFGLVSLDDSYIGLRSGTMLGSRMVGIE
jgi:hypothetical protein